MLKNILRPILSAALILNVMAPASYAQSNYNIKEMTPAVEQALEGRRGRFDQLAALKANGSVGENNRGYVEVLSGGSDAAGIVNAENADRRVIYETIAEQNGLKDALATIESVFAQVQREKAASGEMVQDDSGNWVKK